MIRVLQLTLLHLLLLKEAPCFWDTGTTTTNKPDQERQPSQQLFRWHWTLTRISWWIRWNDWDSTRKRRRLRCVAGISIDSIPLGTATLLSRRTLISSATFVDPFMDRQKDLRIWALGRKGPESVPYRYRVWRVKRLFPKSDNPMHWHGSGGEYVPRHDVAIIYSSEQIYLYASATRLYNYPYIAYMPEKDRIYVGEDDSMWFSRSGQETLQNLQHYNNIKYGSLTQNELVNCTKYIPRRWGKFLCMLNVENFSGFDSGAGLYVSKGEQDFLLGLGCFELTLNEERIFVFTDVRVYLEWINIYTNLTVADDYDYAYPNWLSRTGIQSRNIENDPFVPNWNPKFDLYPSV